MRRGDVVVVRGVGGATTKARPCIVVQRDSTLPDAAKITACPLSSTMNGAAILRPFVVPTSENGLRQPSQIEVDWIFTERIDRFGVVIGVIDPGTMQQVDEALRRFLDL